MSEQLKIVMEGEGGETKLNTAKPKKSGKSKRRPKKIDDGKEDLGAVPPHILRMVQGVEAKQKKREAENKNDRGAPDSVSVFKAMMASVRTKADLDDAGDELRKDKEQDIHQISNARDIFRNMEAGEDDRSAQKPAQEKHRRVEVKTDFMLSGANKAEELRRERLKEMANMRSAREQTFEDESNWNKEQKQKADVIKRQREMELEIMRMARQEALEEEERLEQMNRTEYKRQMSPGLEAARNVSFNSKDIMEDGMNKIDKMRLEREREIEQMKRDRDAMMEEEEQERQDCRSEASRELEAFRASRQSGGLRERFQLVEDNITSEPVSRAPKAKVRGDNWMSSSSLDKQEEARIAREREIEMMMTQRGQAIVEEEEERALEEAQRRMDAERKGREMAMLVADLQRMRTETANSAEEEERMTRYQEEMMQRVMELHDIQRSGIITSN